MIRDVQDWIYYNKTKAAIIAIASVLLIALLITGGIVYQKKEANEMIQQKTAQSAENVISGNTDKIQKVLKDAEKNKKLNSKTPKKTADKKGKSNKKSTATSNVKASAKAGEAVSAVGTIKSIYTNNKAVATTDTFGFSDEVYKDHQAVERAGVEDIRNFMAKKDYDRIVNDYGTGSISIPSIGITLPIIEGTTNDHLWTGATTFYKDQTVKRGNYPLFSHNTGYDGMLFTNLGSVKVGDKIKVISYADGYKQVVNYKVTEKQVVNYKQTDVIADKGDRRLTLITCATAEPTFDRIVVTAKPV